MASQRIVEAGPLDISSDVKEQVGVFCVKRKDHKRLLIVDTRIQNSWFSSAVGQLASREALGDL